MSEYLKHIYESSETTELHEKIEEVEQAEVMFKELFDRITLIDTKLAFEVDDIIGIVSRAYSKQGFNLGMNVARNMEYC